MDLQGSVVLDKATDLGPPIASTSTFFDWANYSSGNKATSTSPDLASSDSGDTFTGNGNRDEKVNQLARQLTNRSSLHGGGSGGTNDDIFAYEKGSDLDPFSETFDAKRWVKTLTGLNRERGSVRASGVSYRNMSVHGFGSDSGEYPVVSERSSR